MVTTKERGQEVRRRLVTAAAGLIAERGWTATTTRAVAERAGVAPGLVHYHFPSIQGLLIEATLQTTRAFIDGLAPLLTGPDPVGALVAALDAHSGTDPLSILLIEACLAATRDEQLRERLGAEIATLRRDLADRLTGVPDPATTAAVVLAALDGVMLHRSLLGRGDGDTAAVLRRLVAS